LFRAVVVTFPIDFWPVSLQPESFMVWGRPPSILEYLVAILLLLQHTTKWCSRG
jgi:hypothetical protein